ncbi:F0F1 ATP synthase subunit B [Patescibacteria group bacterium]
MEDFIETFHVDWKLLIAQLINFAIVLFVVWKWALKPLMKTMSKRSDEIEKSLKDARRIEEELANTEKSKEEKILAAQKEAQAIIENATKETERIKTEKIEATKQEAKEVVEKAKQQIEAEKDKMIADARKEVGGLVIAATEKVIGKKMDDSTDKKLVDDTVQSVK